MNKLDTLKHTGNISQICDALMSRIIGGKDDGVIIINVYTGSGLTFTVVPSRGLDIAQASYNGNAISYISNNGIVSPHLYEEANKGFLRNFTGGLLTTCGLTYMGADSTEKGNYLGMHGRYSNTPASDVNITKEWINDEFVIKITGKISETKLFGENIILKRTITTKLNSLDIDIHDEVENLGFQKVPLMLLYHFNFGYPLLSKNSIFKKSTSTITARDEEALKRIKTYNSFEDPIHSYNEQVFYHEFFEEEKVYGEIVNKELGFGTRITFNKSELPILLEWKMMGEGDYVLGIEPSTNYPLGRMQAKKDNLLKYIEPFEKKEFNLNISIKKFR